MGFEVILLAVVLCIIAGFINGSFPAPTKYMGKWQEENIWFGFSFFGYIILPWVSIMIMAPNVFSVIAAIPTTTLLILICGGLMFGIGQTFNALAFRLIGIGLVFVIGMSLGTAGTALVPILWHPNTIGSVYSYLQLVGILIFICALIFGASAGHSRVKAQKHLEGKVDKVKTKAIFLVIGILFCVFGGIGSFCQGLSYTAGNPSVMNIAMDQGVNSLAANTIAWVLVFTAAFIPNCLWFTYQNIKNKSFSNLKLPKTKIYYFYLVLMAIGFWGSLIAFSGANALIGGDLAPTIAWPLFMVFIIIGSNLWSFATGEWKNSGRKAVTLMVTSIALLIIATGVFTASSVYKPKANDMQKVVKTVTTSKHQNV